MLASPAINSVSLIICRSTRAKRSSTTNLTSSSTVNLLKLFLLTLLLILASQVNASQKPLRIAVSSNFSVVLQMLTNEFNQKHNTNIQLISGSTGALYQQLRHGAPFDMFFSADNIRPRKLEELGLTELNSRRTYALGNLALYSTTQDIIDLDSLKQYSAKLAIANPDTAPYGKAAKQCLTSLGLWEKYKNKLITGSNINQTFQQVRSQAVSLGIVAFSQVMQNSIKNYYLLPSNCYQKINQQLVIMKKTKQPTLAKQFSDFVTSKEVYSRLIQLGYNSGILIPQHTVTPNKID